MRSAWLLLVFVPLGIMATGCSQEANYPRARPADAGMMRARPPAYSAPNKSEAAPADSVVAVAPAESAPAGEVAPRAWPEASKPSRPLQETEPVAPRKSQQSGLLTSGSIDDVEKYDEFLSFLDKTAPQLGDMPRLRIGRRIPLEVTDGQGRPLGGADVTIEPLDAQQQGRSYRPLEVRTASDGRVSFLTGVDGPVVPEFSLQITRPGMEQPYRETLRADDAPWRVTIAGVHAQRPQQLDLMLVVDTTGSMGDELHYLQAEIDAIAAEIRRQFPSIDQRYALVLYRDEGDEYVVRSSDFTGSLESFRTSLSRQSAHGGGDEPEAVHLALEQAEKLSWREGNTARVLFLVGDAPPHDPFTGRTFEAIQGLRREGVRVYPVACSGSSVKAEYVFRVASLLTMAQYLFLTDHSAVGNAHAQPHASEYQVEHLDRLMIRMIASELCGRRLPAGEVIAVESLQDKTDQASPERPSTGPSPNQTFTPFRPSKDPASTPRDAESNPQVAFWQSPHWLILLAVGLGALVVDLLERKGA